jgi:hypothetical protein
MDLIAKIFFELVKDKGQLELILDNMPFNDFKRHALSIYNELVVSDKYKGAVNFLNNVDSLIEIIECYKERGAEGADSLIKLFSFKKVNAINYIRLFIDNRKNFEDSKFYK